MVNTTMTDGPVETIGQAAQRESLALTPDQRDVLKQVTFGDLLDVPAYVRANGRPGADGRSRAVAQLVSLGVLRYTTSCTAQLTPFGIRVATCCEVAR